MEERRKILVVDDDDMNRFLIGDVLKDEGWTIVDVNGGVEACRLLREFAASFALVISDLDMPGGVSGRDVLMTAKKVDPELPVIVMSGRLQGDVVPEAELMSLGAAVTISKPFGVPVLKQLVEQHARR